MRPKGSAELLSDRRRRALKLLGAALSLNEVARRIGCAASSVMRWRNAWRRRGAKSFGWFGSCFKDNSSTHQGEPLRELLDQHPRLRIEHFPSYAPELNPMKEFGLWPSENSPIAAPRTSMS